jgi:hypothetical protein
MDGDKRSERGAGNAEPEPRPNTKDEQRRPTDLVLRARAKQPLV